MEAVKSDFGSPSRIFFLSMSVSLMYYLAAASVPGTVSVFKASKNRENYSKIPPPNFSYVSLVRTGSYGHSCCKKR